MGVSRRHVVWRGLGCSAAIALASPIRVARGAGAHHDILAEGEAALGAGRTQVAIEAFERAASMAHTADAELGLVRAHLQAGRYRQALAFCAHVAGAHRESPAASVFYAWLLRAGGQIAYADRLLAETRQRAPDDPVVTAGARAFAAARPVATDALLDPPHRAAPYSLLQGDQVAPGSDVSVVAAGTLIDGGRSALAPSSALRGRRGCWVRDGLGRTTAAAITTTPERFDVHGLTLLRLKVPLRPDQSAGSAVQSAAGRPGLALTYALDERATPAWPWLQGGFLRATVTENGERRLSLDMGGAPPGGPVLDPAGDVMGLVVRSANASLPVLVPASVWGDVEGGMGSGSGGPRPARLGAVDVAYERGLRLALQVMAAG